MDLVQTSIIAAAPVFDLHGRRCCVLCLSVRDELSLLQEQETVARYTLIKAVASLIQSDQKD